MRSVETTRRIGPRITHPFLTSRLHRQPLARVTSRIILGDKPDVNRVAPIVAGGSAPPLRQAAVRPTISPDVPDGHRADKVINLTRCVP
jgi:hypothetical protein